MKKYISFLFFSIVSIISLAQTSQISGTIVDETGVPLVGASVHIVGSYLGTYSKIDGTYLIDNISTGTYTVEFTYLGYAQQQIIRNISGNVSLNITMIPSANIIDGVVVTALRAQDNTPVAQSNISKQDIERTNLVQDVPYQLEMTPSVVASSENGTGMGYTSMRIRGTDMSRINVTINGIPLNDAESQGVFWVNMADFASSVDDIQIQRGVGTSTNGAASFGASLNFQTLGITEQPYAKISSSVGSFNTFKENIVVGSGIVDSCFALTIRLSKLDSDGWIKRGFSDHKSFFVKYDAVA